MGSAGCCLLEAKDLIKPETTSARNEILIPCWRQHGTNGHQRGEGILFFFFKPHSAGGDFPGGKLPISGDLLAIFSLIPSMQKLTNKLCLYTLPKASVVY